MADTKVNVANNRLAMSRALGAAFLSHQVEQLEKSVGTGTGSGNWRERQDKRGSPPAARRAPAANSASNNGKAPSPRKAAVPGSAGVLRVAAPGVNSNEQHKNTTSGAQSGKKGGVLQVANSNELQRSIAARKAEDKDADIVVVDASVLIHALYKVKKWCRDDRNEILIVPLEALNTLDLLKKGNTPLAQRARAASRILEAQVGTNPRIRVQRDDAFVPWDTIDAQPDGTACPEWVRRIICCTRWEVDHAREELASTSVANKPKVVLAVLSSPSLSPQVNTSALPAQPLTPVPLPAPHPHHAAMSRFEPRSSGTAVAAWAARANLPVLEVDGTLPGQDGDAKRTAPAARGRRPSDGFKQPNFNNAKTGPALVERPPAVMAMMNMVAHPSKSKTVRLLARGEKLDPDT